MMKSSQSDTTRACLVGLALAVSICQSSFGRDGDAASRMATRLLEDSGTAGGLVVHLGCGDGRVTAALCAGQAYLVHGLDRDPAKVAAVHNYIDSLGLSGKVSVERLSGDKLPYIDNLVRLLVAEDLGEVTVEEALRVVCPGGSLLVKNADGTWLATVKPRPDDIDEWTHYLHGPANNAVAEDSVVGPPRRVQWVDGPRWTRDHGNVNSISSVVTAAGRLFFILDEESGATKDPGRWLVVARDAFSGVELWRHPIAAWASHTIRFRSGPPQLPRLLVASADHVYIPLELGGPVSRLDAKTGQVLDTYEVTDGAEEILLVGDSLLVLRGNAAGQSTSASGKAIVAVDIESKEARWQYDGLDRNPMPETLASDGGNVCIQVGDAVICLDLASGQQRWSYGDVPGPGKGPKPAAGFGRYVLVIAADVVLANVAEELTAIAIRDGRKLWSCPGGLGFHAPLDVFVIDGIVWVGDHPSDSVAPPPVGDFSVGRDLHTGEVLRRNSVMVDLQSVGHHHRCYRNKASLRYIMTGKRGIELFEIDGDNHSRNNWLRGTCQYGIMPANGLVYVPPHSCGCYTESMVRGFYAMAPEYTGQQRADIEARKAGLSRLERGPAYTTGAQTGSLQPIASGLQPSPSDWPMFRHDALRSGVVETEIPQRLAKRWEVSIGGKLSQPVVGNGTVIVSAVDRHQVHALDEATGKTIWTRTVGGRVDSPPVIYKGTVLFGCADGRVYCLRLSDGELVWRFLAAPADLRIVSWNRLESVWPVHGSVLVLGDTVYFSAGRSTWLDDGIDLYALDSRSGEVLHHAHFQSEHPKFRQGEEESAALEQRAREFQERIVGQLERGSNRADYKTFMQSDRSGSFSMAGGAVSDILTSDGENVFLHQVKFNSKLEMQAEMSPHLFSTSGFLDDAAEESRTHWVLDRGDFSTLPFPYVISLKGQCEIEPIAGMTLAYDQQAAWSVMRRKPYSKDPMIRVVRSAIDGKRPGESAGDWEVFIGQLRPKAIIKAGDRLWVAATEGDRGTLQTLAVADGQTVGSVPLDVPVVWDGMAAANRHLYLSLEDGSLACFGED